MLIDMLVYRDWAIDAAIDVQYSPVSHNEFHRHYEGEPYCPEAILTFLVGWSQIVPLEFYENRIVLVVHPSPLPLYRGGSPIQHQIMAGETDSAVTLFKLDKDYPEVDSGPIFRSKIYSLDGQLHDILKRISDASSYLMQAAIREYYAEGSLQFLTQNEKIATTFRRRTPEQSEITQEEIALSTAKQLYNKVRALQDPYPNAFITDGDGQKLYITQAHL